MAEASRGGRPRKHSDEGGLVRLSVLVPLELRDQVRAAAAARGTRLTDEVIASLRKHVRGVCQAATV